MTKEQEESLEKIKRQILIGECKKNIGIPVYISDLKNVLSMLEEKDKIIQFKEDINNTALDRHKKTEKSLKGQIIKQNKMIGLMAEFIEDELTVDEFCTKESCYADNYIDGHCEKCLNCIKQYFENKAKERR